MNESKKHTKKNTDISYVPLTTQGANGLSNNVSTKNIKSNNILKEDVSFVNETKGRNKHVRTKSYNGYEHNLTNIPTKSHLQPNNSLKYFENFSFEKKVKEHTHILQTEQNNVSKSKEKEKVVQLRQYNNTSVNEAKERSNKTDKYANDKIQNVILKTNKALKQYIDMKLNKSPNLEQNEASIGESTLNKFLEGNEKSSTSVDTVLKNTDKNVENIDSIEEMHYVFVKSFQKSKEIMNLQENQELDLMIDFDKTVVAVDEYDLN